MSRYNSFNIIMINMVFFMAAMASVRISLVIYLQQHHLPISLGFLTATSMASIQLVCMYLWPRIFKKITPPTYASLICFGAALSTIGLILMFFFQHGYLYLTLSLTFFVIGNSLFLLNIRTLVSLHHDSKQGRQHANQLFYLIMNIGAAGGLVLGALFLIALEYVGTQYGTYQNVYLLNIALMGFATIYMLKRKQYVISPQKETNVPFNLPVFSTAFMLTFIFAWLSLYFIDLERAVVFGLFGFALCVAVYNRKKSGVPIPSLFILIFANIIYWIVLSIMYFQFGSVIHYYANIHLNDIHIPLYLTYVLDPLTCLGMGIIIMAWNNKKETKFQSLRIGLCFMCFGVLMVCSSFSPTDWDGPFKTIQISYIFLAILACAFGEFKIAPSLTAQLADITPHKSQLRGLMGTLSLSTALGNTLAFYLMKISYKNTTDIHTNLKGDFHLFSSLTLFLVSLLFIVYIISFVKWAIEGIKKWAKKR